MKKLIIGFIVLLVACQEDTINPEATGTLSGSVIDQLGEAMGNVQVETSPASSIVLTDSAGAFIIEGIAMGEYTVTAKRANFKNESVQVTVSENQTTRVVMSLESRAASQGNLSGTLLDAVSNQPIVGASITTHPPTVALVTNATGQFVIDSLPIGDYTVIAKKGGFQTDSVSVAVKEGKSTPLTMLLTPSDPTAFNVPVQPQPAIDARDQPSSLTLQWSVERPRAGAELRYDVLLYEADSPNGRAIAENLTDTSWAVSDLAFNKTYFWQVVAKDERGNRTTGDLWTFQTEAFPATSFLFSRNTEYSHEIFTAGADAVPIQITGNSQHDAFPRFSAQRQWVAYSSSVDGQSHLYVMRADGTQSQRITTLPLAGYHHEGGNFCWSPDGAYLLYGHYERLYRIHRDGTGLTLLTTAPEGRHFKALDWSPVTNQLVIQTVGSDINDTELYLADANGGNLTELVGNLPGRIESPSFSVDGRAVLYTRDVVGFENATGRQLDAHIFLHNLDSSIVDLSASKPAGTNDTRPRFSPDGAYVIFENASNADGASKSVWKMDAGGGSRELLFENAETPDWG